MSDMFELKMFGFEEYAAKMRKAPRIVEEEMVIGINRITLAGESAAKKIVPVATGNLRRSIIASPARHGIGGEVKGQWGTTVPYAADVERGTPPGRMVDAKTIEAWKRRKAGRGTPIDAPTRLIMRAIYKYGTDGKWYMKASRLAIEPAMRAEFRAVRDRIVARIDG